MWVPVVAIAASALLGCAVMIGTTKRGNRSMDALNRRNVLRAGVVTTALAGGVAAGVAVARQSAAAVPAPGDGWISVLDHGAAGDGVTDDTAAIQAALNAARATAPSRGVYLPPGRRYRINRVLRATGLTDFILSGYGATLVLAGAVAGDPGGGVSMLELTDCHRFRVLGLGLWDSDRTETYCGINLSRCSAGVLDGMHVRDVKWTGISVFDPTPRLSTDISITNCVVEGTRFGISTNGADVRIVNNHVAMYWPSTAEAAAKRGVWSAPSDYYDGIMVLDGADRTVVAGNTVTECGQGGIFTERCTNLVVADNTVAGCQLRGIEVAGTGVSITGNVVTGCIGQINLVYAKDVTVVGNHTENPHAAKESSCIAVNIDTSRATVLGNRAVQAHPTHPAMYVHSTATDVTLALNDVIAPTPYQVPASTTLIHRGGPGQFVTSGKLIALGGIGVGNSARASSVGKVVRKIEVFSSTGASLGWIPVYGSIS
jgi:hypothetical protein